jgi:hypothetical protein
MDLIRSIQNIILSLPSIIGSLICNISYNIIYYYSVTEIKYKKIKRIIIKFLNKYQLINNNSDKSGQKIYNYDIEFILDGKVIQRSSKDMLDEIYDETMRYPKKYDFIIYTEFDKDADETSSNKKIIRDHTQINSDLSCEKSEIKFLLCEFELGNKKIKIDFKNEFSNYYINGNTFDIKFFIYFLQKYYSDHLSDDDLEKIHNFRVNILDHNVNNETIINNNTIKINNNNYEKLLLTDEK